MIIRWLGAFRKNGQNLTDSLIWETIQTERPAVAAERLNHKKSYIRHARIGLLVRNSALLRKYKSDVWSEYRGKTLVRTRKEDKALSNHSECFVRPDYLGVVLKDHKKITNTALQAVKDFCDQTGMPCYLLTRDRRLLQIRLT